MTETSPSSSRSLACRDLGLRCEWEIRSGPVPELERRFREHYRCAHGGAEPPSEISRRLNAALGTG
jgi:predicted small metal-binding protein